MRSKYKPWALPYLKEHSDLASATYIKDDSFYQKSFELEIGGGKGDFIIALASKYPSKQFLMVERDVSVAAVALKKIVESKLNNVHIIYDNFINFVHDINDNSIKTIYLNFSDPWPKKRHEKRRLTSPLFLNDYHRILKKDGLIKFKTDQKDLYEFTKMLIDNKKFAKIIDNSNYIELEEDDFMSEYEKKFRARGNKIYRLVLKKL